MSRNAGQRFLQGFQPNFLNMFDTSFKTGEITEERERERNEKLKYQQEQAGILQQLVGGKSKNKTQDVPPLDPYIGMQGNWKTGYYGYGDPRYNKEKAYQDTQREESQGLSQEDLTNLISSADDNTLQRYKLISEMNKPEKVDYEEWDGNKYLKNLDGSVDFTKPVTQKEEKPDFVETDYVGNKQIRREFYKQKDGTVKSVDIPTGFLKETRTSKEDGNGNLYETLNKDYQKELKQRADRFLTSLDMKVAADKTKDGIPYSDPLTGMKYTITSETANGMVESGKTQLQNFLDNNGGEQNKSYFKNIQLESWDAVQKEGQGDHGVTTWKYIEEDYIQGTITDADFLEARYRFIAKWGYDPTTRLR